MVSCCFLDINIIFSRERRIVVQQHIVSLATVAEELIAAQLEIDAAINQEAARLADIQRRLEAALAAHDTGRYHQHHDDSDRLQRDYRHEDHAQRSRSPDGRSRSRYSPAQWDSVGPTKRTSASPLPSPQQRHDGDVHGDGSPRQARQKAVNTLKEPPVAVFTSQGS